ncbi:MAG: hypothetical protein CMM94_06240 [Rickettsiales bacterium]|nr:hypothetical protein [Rickettsiales bacterium]
MKPTVTWVVLADAGTVKTFRNEGPADGLHKLPNYSFSQDIPLSGELSDTERGREQAPVTQVHHAFAPTTNPRDKEKTEFLHDVAKTLNAAAKAKEFDRLIIFAAPQALGTLRQKLEDVARNLVTDEVAKDLTHTSENELPKHLEDYLLVHNSPRDGMDPAVADRVLRTG